MNKVAFFTMDVESYYDTLCLKNKSLKVDTKYNCAQDVQKFCKLMNEFGIHCTLFVVADFIKECKEYLLEAIKDGHEIALHCLHHECYQDMSKEQFIIEINKARELVKNELGVEPVGFRFPGLKFKKEHYEAIMELGFLYDSSLVSCDKSFRKIINSVYLKNNFYEFSPNYVPFLFKKINISSVGYQRFLKCRRFDSLILKFIHKNQSFLLYLHPFEIHEGELPIPKKMYLHQKRYLNRNRGPYFTYLNSLIAHLRDDGYAFLSMKEYIDLTKCKY